MTGPEPLTASDAADLAKFGYKESLERRTGRFASFAVAFAFVSIATGIFTTYGAVLNSSGPVGIWTWPIAVIGQLAVAFILGALAARIPVTGYHYQWMSRLANPVLGWILGWISFTFLAIVVVAVDYTIASTIMPVLLNYEGTATAAWIVTALVLLVQAALVAFSTPWAERVNNTLVSLELIGMVALTVLLLIVAAVRGHMDFSNLFSKGAVPAEGFWSFGDLTTAGPWMLGFLLGAFTIVGFESAANLAEETNDPERRCPAGDVASRPRLRCAWLLLPPRRDAGRGRPGRAGRVRNADRRRHRHDTGFGRRHPPAGDGGAGDLRLRSGDHDDRCAGDLGHVS